MQNKCNFMILDEITNDWIMISNLETCIYGSHKELNQEVMIISVF